MSDSDQDRNTRGGRGSLLDLASRSPNGARISASGGKRSAAEKQEGAVFTGSEGRTPRLSTRRAGHAEMPEPDQPRALGRGQSNFGRHIAGLLSLSGGNEPASRRDEPSDGSDENTPLRDDKDQGHPTATARRGEPAYPPAAVYVEDRYPEDRYPQDRYPDDRYNGDRPLIDITVLLGSVWRFRRLIVATTVLGAVAGVVIALSTPKRYYAENRIFVDPREVRLTDDDLRNQLLSTEAMIAMTDSQVEILSSNNVLSKVVDKLNLTRDPEFNGSANAGGLAGGIALIRQLISGTESNEAAENEAINAVREALAVSRDPKTFVINVGVVTRDAEKSALLANTVVDTYLSSEDAAQSGLMERTSEAIDSRLESLRADLNAAERAVENFRAENDLVGVGGELIDDKQVVALSQQLANARAQKVAVRVKAENLAKADVRDIIDGAFPEEFLSANLVELRKQFAQTKANTDSLASRLGPRHPQYMAASSSLESTRGQIRAELRRIVASSQAELQRAVETEQELASQLAVAKTKSLDNSEELVTLRELERKAAATRQIYEGFLKRSRETSERGNLNTQNVRVISSAEPPTRSYGPSRKVMAIGGMVLGFLAGLAIAIAFGLFGIVRGFLPDGDPDPNSDRDRSLSGRIPPAAPAARRQVLQRQEPTVASVRAEAPAPAGAVSQADPIAEPERSSPQTSPVPQAAAEPQPVPQTPAPAWPVAPPAPLPVQPGYPQYYYPPAHGYPMGQPYPAPWAWGQTGYPPYAPPAVPAPYPYAAAPQQPMPQPAASEPEKTAGREEVSDREVDRIRRQMRDLRHRIDRKTRRRSA